MSLIHREAWFPGGPRIPKNQIFLKNKKNHLKRKNSKTSRDMPKNIGHLTLGNGGKKTFQRYLKSEQTVKQTDGHSGL